jgi:hypothetical protein
MGIFGSGSVNTAAPPAAASGLQLQTSQFGSVVPICWGNVRLAPNVIWYGDFQAVEHHQSQGGKGGPNVDQTSFTYKASFVLGLCEGPISSVATVWKDKDETDAATIGFLVFSGNDGQPPWGYLSTSHADQALAYSGTAYAAIAGLQMDNPDLPQFAMEVRNNTGGDGQPDWLPSIILTDYLTNARYGCLFPAARIGDLTQWQNYCQALDLRMAPCLIAQEAASDFVQRLADLTNTAPVWSATVLKMIPYGDTALSTATGSFTPNVTPVVDLTEDNFVDSDEPVRITLQDPADANNSITLTFEDRSNKYNETPAGAKDQAAIEAYGLRPAGTMSAKEYKTQERADLAAQLILQRKVGIRATFEFTLTWNFFTLEPMDLVTLTVPALGLNKYVVRLTRVQEDDSGNIVCEAEDFPQGVAHAAKYARQQANGYKTNYNTGAGLPNAPVFFEPTDAFRGDLEVILTATSASANWGGADVWVSQDGETYTYQDTIHRGARSGYLTADLPAVAAAATGKTIDKRSTLAVDISECAGTLVSVSQADALAGNTLCWVDGELIAYQTAALTGSGKYSLSYLVRGLFDTPIKAHKKGARFVRLGSIGSGKPSISVPFTEDRLGSTLYVKLLSFNIYGSNRATLDGVSATPYTIQGTALFSPPPAVTGLTTVFIAGLTQLSWKPVDDFRKLDYEVRKGDVATNALRLGTTSEVRFPTYGDGTYWVAAHYKTKTGVHVYSPWTEIVVAGAALVSNVIATWDEKATGWSGTVTGQGALSRDVAGGEIVLSGADILSLTDFLNTPDVLHAGGTAGSVTYQIPTAHQIDIGRVAACNVMVTWDSWAEIVGADVLSSADFLGMTDLFNEAAAHNTSVLPEIRLAQADGVWSDWRPFIPGAYTAQHFDARVTISSSDPQTIAELTSFTFAVDVPDRVEDHAATVFGGGPTTITYPGGAFNGAPGAGQFSIPNPQVTVLNPQSGDVVSITHVTRTGFWIEVMNGVSSVSRSITYRTQGW